MHMPKLLSISDQLRHAIEDSGLSRYRIAKESGLSQSLLSRFMSGDRGLSLEAIDKLGTLLGFRLVLDRISKKGKA